MYIGNFIPALILDRIGRKYCILIGIIPKIVSALFLVFATKIWMVFLGRALNGMSDAFIFIVVPMYASEIASTDVRGSLGTILQIMCSLGIVVMLSVGPFISYLAVNILLTAAVLVSAVPLIFLPDSPYFLYSKGRTAEALAILEFLRGSESAANLELKEYALEKKVEDIGLGTFFYVTSSTKSITGFMNFLPLMSLILIVFCYSAGPGSLIWALTAELFDNSARAFGLSICMTINMITMFITTRYFASLMSTIGPAATYWSFGTSCLLLCLFIIFFIPETKGKSFSDIQKAMGAENFVCDEVDVK
ncbi:unnamed protein product [Diatraea saccharalis]|uniref:Major facilitator superfamily (MFS) profile domain-containing protein n=1 Tax=Diatraea saccharalis TaxID=40085 RepID=A0A9N9WK16_9NEOP|nr:unnamed protein product [Diatraea saccharalis]